MEETDKQSEAHLTSAAAFVEGGIQDACDDACSICLEAFTDSDPSTLTTCKHEFHLQCILEWCQRSSQCPMCWQPISLKDPTSQELLEAVERERSFSFNQSRNATIFHHPTLGEFELQHLPVGVNDAELEERIIQHLAAAAAMGRARHNARRESQRNRSSAQGRPQFMVFSTHPNATNADPVSSSPTQREGEAAPTITVAAPSSPTTVGEESPQRSTQLFSAQAGHVSASASGSSPVSSGQVGNTLNSRRSPNQPSPISQDKAGPSDFQSFSESLKSRFNTVSMRYKESISKSARGWKERFFSRNNNMADLGSEDRREINTGISTVSSMMECLDTRDNNSNSTASVSRSPNNSVPESNNKRILGSEDRREVNTGISTVSSMEGLDTRDNNSSTASVSRSPNNSVPESNNKRISETAGSNHMNDTNVPASCATSSGSN